MLQEKNKFAIEVITKKPKIVDGLLSYWGKITIGDYQDIFVIPLSNWTIEQYKEQWGEGLERIKTHNSSCIITDIRTVKIRPKSICVELWFLYKLDSIVFLQNRILGGAVLKEMEVDLFPFDLNTFYLRIPPRKNLTENGRKIVEWSVNISDI